MSSRIQSHYRGFTLIELSLALVFLSVLLITIAMLTIHISTSYQKGLAIQSISSTGRELIDEFSRSISDGSSINAESLCASRIPVNTTNGSPYKKCLDDNAKLFIYQQRSGNVTIKGNPDETIQAPTSGILCTGHYSYIYNSGYVLDASKTIYDYNTNLRSSYINKNDNTYKQKKDDFRLLKVSDPSRALCSQGVTSNYTTDASVQSYETSGTVEELLTSTEDDLALYDLKLFNPSRNTLTQQAFYSGTFILATIRGGVNIKSSGDYCSSPPENLATDFAYCAINKFNFATRATGGTS